MCIFPARVQQIESDKVQHFMVSAVAGAIVVNVKPDWPSGQQFLVAMVPGLTKEFVNSRKGAAASAPGTCWPVQPVPKQASKAGAGLSLPGKTAVQKCSGS